MSSSASGQPLPMAHHDTLQTADLKDHNGLPLGLQTQQHDQDSQRQAPVNLLDLKAKAAKPKNPKKYRCTYCDRAFTRSEHRSRHERSHTKEKPFHCEKCPSAFVRRDLLLRHDRTVHAVRNGQPKAANARAGAASKTDASKKANGAAANAKDTTNKRKRTSAAEAQILKPDHHTAEPNMDADFNAAFVMTALQHSYQKQHSPTNPKPLPSPPTNEYLPPLGFQPQSHGGPNALDLSTQVHHNSVKHRDGPSTSPQLGSTAAIHAASSSANQPNHHTNQQQQQHHHHRPISPQYSHHQHTGSNGTYSLNAFLNPVREAPGGNATSSVPGAPGTSTAATTHGTTASAGFDQPPHIPQFDATFQISSLLKFLNDDKNTLSTPPTRVQLNRYLSAYFTFFHPQLPFLHPPTFDPPNVAPSLLFAVCSVGAVLCHESAQAAVLHSNAKMLVSSIYEVDKDFPNARNTPLWAIQSLILTLVYSSWNGDPRGLEFISSVRTSVSSLATNAFYDNTIQTEPNDQSQSMHWKRWLLEESAKRALFAVFMTFGALVQMYNYPTALNNSDVPAKIQLPCSEVLWNTSFGSENDWMYHYLRETNDTCSHPQFSHALALFTQEQSHQIVQQLSPFAQKIMATALFNEVLNPQASIPRDRALSIIKGWELNARDNHPGQGQMVTQIATNSSLVCISLPMEDHMNFLFNGPSPLLTRIRAQHPLLVAGYITTLVTQVRLLVDLTSVQEVIRYHVPTDICNAALNSYTVLSTTGLLRSPSLTSLVTRCFDLYRLPSLLGLRLVKSLISTPMISANIESLLCGFELSVVLIMWCHRVEQDMANGETLDEEEAVLYSVIERTCFDCGLEKVHGQLAPTLALFASELFDGETWELANILSMSLRSFGYALMPHQGAARRMRHSSAAASTAGSTPNQPNNYGSQPAQQQSQQQPAQGSSQQQSQQQQQQQQPQSQQQSQQPANQPHTHHPAYPAQSHPQSSLRTTADRDILMMPFKPMTG